MTISPRKSTTACVVFFMQANYFLSMSSYNETVFGETLETMSFLFAIGFLFLHYAIEYNWKLRINQILIASFVGTLSIATFFLTSGGTLIKMLIFVLAFYNVNTNDILRYFYKSNITIITFVGLSALLGIIDNTVVWKNGYAYGLGFNPNILGLGIFFTAVIHLYLNYYRIRKIWWTGLVLAILTNVVTKSRATASMLAAIVVMVAMDKMFHIAKSKTIRFLAQNTFLAGTAVSLFIAANFTFSSSYWNALNSFMASRPSLYNLYYRTFPIKLFGNYFSVGDYGPLDNTYLMLLFRYGLLIYLIYYLFFVYAKKFAIQSRDYVVLLISLTYAVYFIVEYSSSLINFNFVTIYFWAKFWGGFNLAGQKSTREALSNQRSSPSLQLRKVSARVHR